MSGKAHPNDILVVSNMREAREWAGKFEQRQIFTVSRPDRIEGRRFRYAWVTRLANHDHDYTESGDRFFHTLMRNGAKMPGYREGTEGVCRYADEWEPEEPNLVEQIKALRDGVGNGMGEFGRGYKLAIKDVLALIAGTVSSDEVQV